MKRGPKIFFWVIGIIAFLLLLITITVPLVLSPKRLTPLINNYASTYVRGQVNVGEAEANVWSSFPYISVTLKDGHVIVPQFYPSVPAADSMFTFDFLDASVRILPLLQGKINVRHLELRNASMYLCCTPQGIANWDIFGSDTLQTDTTSSAPLKLDVNKLYLQDNIHFTYNDLEDTVYFATDVDLLDLKAKAFSTMFNAELISKANTLVVGSTVFFDHTSLDLKGGVGFGRKPAYGNVSMEWEEYLFDKCQAVLGGIPLYLDGFLGLRTDSLELQATCRISDCLADTLLSLVPESMLSMKKDILAPLPLHLDATLNGAYNYLTGDLPSYDIQFTLGPGEIQYLPQNVGIRKIEANIATSYNPEEDNQGNIDISKLFVDAPWLQMDAHGFATELFDNPHINMSATANLLLDSIAPLFMDYEKAVASGSLQVDAEAQLKWSDVSLDRIGRTSINCNLSTEGLNFRLPADSIFIIADSTHISMGVSPSEPLFAEVNTDSLNVVFKYKYMAQLSRTELQASGDASLLSSDTTQVHPFSGTLKSRYLNILSADSTRVNLQNAQGDFSVAADSANTSLAQMKAHLNASSLSGVFDVHRATFQNADIDFEVSPNSLELRRQAQAQSRRDSIRQARANDTSATQTRGPRVPRVGGRQRDELAYADITIDLDRDTRQLLRNWDVNGVITSSYASVATPYFPLRNSIEKLKLKVNSDYIDISNTRLRTGRSDILFNGRLSNIREALSRRGKIGLTADIQSDTLDCNQLIQAANAGSLFAQQMSQEEINSLKATLISDKSSESIGAAFEETVDTTVPESDLVVVPGNVDLEVVLGVSNAYFRQLQLQQLHGLLRSDNHILQLNELKANSSVGDITISALYATPDKQNISAGFDLELQRVQLEEVIRMIPSLDTLFPMLQSFEGSTNVQLSAVSSIDTTMHFILPSLYGACRITGDNMVLLDGETFTKISDLLMFSKKSRNQIDHIGVEVTVANSEVNVYPFVMALDHYKAAVSGVHNLDMTFNYHISVIQSPLFRLGVNVNGNPDDIKFKLGKCLYQDEHVPSYSYKIDSIRTDLRSVITQQFSNENE